VIQDQRHAYYACVSYVDEHVGAILGTLDQVCRAHARFRRGRRTESPLARECGTKLRHLSAGRRAVWLTTLRSSSTPITVMSHRPRPLATHTYPMGVGLGVCV